MILRRLIAALVVALWPMILWAQGTASLVADTVTLDGSGRLVAQGNVQAFYDGSTLSAAQIVYDPGSDRLVIEGPIFLRSPDGQIITAERAELDPSFENGLLRGARIVLDQQLQLAANQIARIDNGRYSALTRAVASSCQVCPGRAPLWEIRADSLLHDTEARQLYFENATLRVRGVPILWVPRMRLPDPSNPRSTGLLIPQIRSSDLLGFGLRVPYFITLGENRDLLVAPFVSSETRTLEARYRQAFLEGGLRIDGAISRDSIRPDEWRWYLFSNAIFDIGAGIELRFSGESVSDPFYLRDYGYDDRDRLANRLSLLRVGDTSLFQARGTLYESLRLDEPDASLPPIVLGFAYEETIDTRLLGGRLNWGVSGDATLRSIGAQADDSRDVARLGAELGWQDSWIAPAGLIVDAEAELRLDYYNVEDDPEAGQGWRAGPAAAVTLRWPLVRPGGDRPRRSDHRTRRGDRLVRKLRLRATQRGCDPVGTGRRQPLVAEPVSGRRCPRTRPSCKRGSSDEQDGPRRRLSKPDIRAHLSIPRPARLFTRLGSGGTVLGLACLGENRRARRLRHRRKIAVRQFFRIQQDRGPHLLAQ
nr:LPS assembly protein LptD [Alexandriicola marinus]